MMRDAKEQWQTTSLGQLLTFYTGQLLPTLLKDYRNWTGKICAANAARIIPPKNNNARLRSSLVGIRSV